MNNHEFRGKRKDNKQWVYGYYFKTPLTDEATGSKPEDGWSFLSGRERHCISQNGCVYEVIPETIGKYSGFEDKNKNKIYKGDILYNYDFDCAFEVEWDEECGFWAADIVDDGGREMLNEYIDCTACIIGNIYDEVGD